MSEGVLEYRLDLLCVFTTLWPYLDIAVAKGGVVAVLQRPATRSLVALRARHAGIPYPVPVDAVIVFALERKIVVVVGKFVSGGVGAESPLISTERTQVCGARPRQVS